MSVDDDLGASGFDIRHTGHSSRQLQPSGQLRRMKPRIARRRSEKEHFLASDEHAAPQRFREYLGKPGTGAEDEVPGRDMFPIASRNGREQSALPWRFAQWDDGSRAVAHAFGNTRVYDRGDRAARHQHTDARLPQGPFDPIA